MSDTLDRYAKTRPASLLDRARSIGRPGVHEQRLLARLVHMTQERLEELSNAGALSATEWSATSLLSSMSVEMNIANTPGSWGANERFYYTLFKEHRKPYRDETFFSFGCAARQAQLALLGEEAFLERHWERVSKQIRKLDAIIRAKRGLPEPAGLAAWRERQTLEAAAAPARASKGPSNSI